MVIDLNSAVLCLYIFLQLQHLKENYANRSMQEYVDEAKLKATWIWEELNKEPAAATEAEKVSFFLLTFVKLIMRK